MPWEMICDCTLFEPYSLSSSESSVSAVIETSEASSSSSSFVWDIFGGDPEIEGSSESPDTCNIGGASNIVESGVDVPGLFAPPTLPSVAGIVES